MQNWSNTDTQRQVGVLQDIWCWKNIHLWDGVQVWGDEILEWIKYVCVNWLRYRPQHSFLMFHRDVMFGTSDELLCFLSAGLIRLVFLSLNIPFCFSPLPPTFSLLHSALLHIHTIARLLVFLQCSSLTCKHVAVRLCLNRNLTRTQTHMRCCITEVFPQ